jgi:hypothetical protein
MPVTAVAGDGFQVRIVGRQEGQETNNVLNFVAATSIDDVELRLIAALAECFVTNLLPVLSSKWTLEKIVWKQVRPTLGVEYVTIPAGAGAGAGSSAALPSYASACISIRTAEGGRSKRGRMYIAGLPEDSTTDSQFNTGNAFWTALAAFCACVVTKFVLGDPPAANSFQLEVYSRKIGGASFPYGASGYTPVVNLIPDVIVATTRSRKLGRGA